jgi:hypothetical protein
MTKFAARTKDGLFVKFYSLKTLVPDDEPFYQVSNRETIEKKLPTLEKKVGKKLKIVTVELEKEYLDYLKVCQANSKKKKTKPATTKKKAVAKKKVATKKKAVIKKPIEVKEINASHQTAININRKALTKIYKSLRNISDAEPYEIILGLAKQFGLEDEDELHCLVFDFPKDIQTEIIDSMKSKMEMAPSLRNQEVERNCSMLCRRDS